MEQAAPARYNSLSDARDASVIDAEGNRASKSNPTGSWTYVYDNANRLTEVDEYNSTPTLLHKTVFKYDAFGNRIEKIVDGAPVGPVTLDQRYALDGWKTGPQTSFVGNENWDVWADLDSSNNLTTR